MGTNTQTLSCWDHDTLDKCSPDDQIQVWSIHSSEILHYDKDKVEDDILCKMLFVGLLDKKLGHLHGLNRLQSNRGYIWF